MTLGGPGVGAGVLGQAPDPDILPQDTLRKYITFAKQRRRPRLQGNHEKIVEVGLRRQHLGLTWRTRATHAMQHAAVMRGCCSA